jgi:hypothetical protein
MLRDRIAVAAITGAALDVMFGYCHLNWHGRKL